MDISLSNYKEWLPFAIIAAGVVLALIAPLLPHNRQRREKTMELLAKFKASMHAHDLAHWKEIYLGTRKAVAVPAGHFIDQKGKVVPLETMWTAGNDDHTAIQRMAECMEKLCADMLEKPVDSKMVWYEIGQLMQAMQEWLASFPGVQRDLTFLEEQYPSIKQVFDKYSHRFEKWPYRAYVNL